MQCQCLNQQIYLSRLAEKQHHLNAFEAKLSRLHLTHHQQIEQIQSNHRLILKQLQQQVHFLKQENLNLQPKIDKYRLRCHVLNQKIANQSIDLTQKHTTKLQSETQIIKLSEKLQKEKEKNAKLCLQVKELKLIIEHQESQLFKLEAKCKFAFQNQQNFQQKSLLLATLDSKFLDLERISQERFAEEFKILRNKLELQFENSTSSILQEITCPLLNHPQPQQKRAIEKTEDLSILCRCIELGTSFFENLFEKPLLKTKQGQQVFTFMQQTLERENRLQKSSEHYREAMDESVNELRENAKQLQTQLFSLTPNRLNYSQASVQTIENINLLNIVQTNSFLKSKLSSSLKILSWFAQFSFHLFSIIQQRRSKAIYHKFLECYFFKCNKGLLKYTKKTNRFRVVAKSILFLQILSKKLKRMKRVKMEKQKKAESLTKCDGLQNIVMRFLRKMKEEDKSQYKIEEVMKKKSSDQDYFVQILKAFQRSHNDSIQNQNITTKLVWILSHLTSPPE